MGVGSYLREREKQRAKHQNTEHLHFIDLGFTKNLNWLSEKPVIDEGRPKRRVAVW